MAEKSDYAALLRDPRWQKKRLEILNRDNWTCQLCGDTEATLHVHHMMYTYGNAPWDYLNETLVTLCESCHETESADKKPAMNLLSQCMATAGLHSGAIQDLALFIDLVRRSGVDASDVMVALNFLALSPGFINSLFNAHCDYGPWNDGQCPNVVWQNEIAGAAGVDSCKG